jgi:hypothetical protein
MRLRGPHCHCIRWPTHWHISGTPSSQRITRTPRHIVIHLSRGVCVTSVKQRLWSVATHATQDQRYRNTCDSLAFTTHLKASYDKYRPDAIMLNNPHQNIHKTFFVPPDKQTGISLTRQQMLLTKNRFQFRVPSPRGLLKPINRLSEPTDCSLHP